MRFSWTLASLLAVSLSYGPAYAQGIPKKAAFDWIDTNAETLKHVNKNIWKFFD